ncbi:MAG: hypothetical protein K0S26_2012 [Bacteroidota bacterium]|jgi:hypothetical protein|nr:hypothetical protein [Bacteroidota bacterium]
MRLFLLFFVVLPIALISGIGDSLANAHYKVKFSLQDKISYSTFKYKTEQGYYNYVRGGEYGHSESYSESIHSRDIWNPELKIDFELPYWLKVTCGVNHNVLKFDSGYGEIRNTSVNYIYAPNSTQYNPIVIGENRTESLEGYFKEKVRLSMASTFLGLGMARQFGKFNFDFDYSFSVHKALYGERAKSYYDVNNNFLKSDETSKMEYGGELEKFFFSHNMSTSISYRICRRINLKLGYIYSFYLKDIDYEGTNYSSRVNNLRTNALFFGISFSII